MFNKIFGKYSKKTATALVCLIIVATIATSATLAFIIVETAQLLNQFQVAEVNVTTNAAASTFTVDADSDTSAYIRVAIVVNYQDTLGSVYRVGAVLGTHYDLNESLDGTNWIKGSDGYYYYKSPVAVGGTTQTLPVTVTSRTLPDGEEDPTGGGKYKLTVTYAVTAVQATPLEAVEEAWGVTLNGDQISAVNP